MSVDVVPDSWCIGKGQCSVWPPARVSNTAACVKEKKCPEKTWKRYNIKRILEKCDKNRAIHQCVFISVSLHYLVKYKCNTK